MNLPTPRIRSSLLVALGFMASTVAMAACERKLQVPVSPTGQSLTVNGERIGGIYKDLLDAISSKSKCTFVFSPVPRARQERLFEVGQADVMLAVTRSPERDAAGIFIPMVRNRATVISFGSAERKAFTNSPELLKQSNVRLVAVRGFNFGPHYSGLLDTMQAEGRLVLEPDPLSVARWLRSNPNDVTVMAPITLYGALMDDERMKDMLDTMRVEPIDDMPWGESGIYLSRTSMPAGTLKYLRTTIQRETRGDYLYKKFSAIYPSFVLKGSVMPLVR